MPHWTFLLHDTNTKANITAIANSAVQPVWLAKSYDWNVTTHDNAIGFCYSCYHMTLCNFGYILRVALAHGLLSIWVWEMVILGGRTILFCVMRKTGPGNIHPKTAMIKLESTKKLAIDIHFFTSSTYPCIKAPCTFQQMFGWNQTTNHLVPPLSTSNHRRYVGIL